MHGPIPALATWGWAVPFYAVTLVILLRPSWLAWAEFDLPGWVRRCGALALTLTPIFLYWILRALGDNLADAFAAVAGQKLVTRGPYRYIRHPLYALEFVFLLSLAAATANWIILAFASSGIIVISLVVIPHEEEYLRARFRNAYETYRQRTGRLTPKMRSKGKPAYPLPVRALTTTAARSRRHAP